MARPHDRSYQHHSDKYIEIMKKKKFEHESKIGDWEVAESKEHKIQ